MADRTPTLRLSELPATWAAIYQRRDRMEAEAAEQVLAAWRELAVGIDLGPVIAVLRQQTGPAEADQVAAVRRQHLLKVTSAAVLAVLAGQTSRPGWPRLIAALIAVLRGSRAAGRTAGHAVVDDDSELPDDDGDGSGDDGGDQDTNTAAAYTVTAAALRATAQTIARALLNAAMRGDDERAMQAQAAAALTGGAAWTLAATTASAAAFIDGLTGTYLQRGVEQIDFVTAGDGRVCPTCSDAEDGNPYPASSVPQPPLHPNCRCTVQPTT